jgi:hypothetical protein
LLHSLPWNDWRVIGTRWRRFASSSMGLTNALFHASEQQRDCRNKGHARKAKQLCSTPLVCKTHERVELLLAQAARWAPRGAKNRAGIAASAGASIEFTAMTRCPKRRFRRWSVVLIAAFLVAGCSSGKDFDLAQAQVAHFRELMAAQKFDQIYSEASDELKKTTTDQAMARLLGAVDRKLGGVKSAKQNAWNVNYAPSATSVTIKFKTQFERGAGEETFVYRIAGGKALLAGYHINSNELITN